jgi:class 3 adenylate cyclase
MTVLFTDLEGHTALFEDLGTDRAHALVVRLLTVMTEAVRGHDGTVVKTEGDGVIATFSGVRSALQCAVDIQRRTSALSDERPVRVRIGVNTGDAIREGDDVMGVTVIKAARIMSHATGGEILIGEASRLLLGPGGDWKIAAKGWFTLKGISRRERLYQVEWRTPS